MLYSVKRGMGWCVTELGATDEACPCLDWQMWEHLETPRTCKIWDALSDNDWRPSVDLDLAIFCFLKLLAKILAFTGTPSKLKAEGRISMSLNFEFPLKIELDIPISIFRLLRLRALLFFVGQRSSQAVDSSGGSLSLFTVLTKCDIHVAQPCRRQCWCSR